jgi:hypothetical protein
MGDLGASELGDMPEIWGGGRDGISGGVWISLREVGMDPRVVMGAFVTM